MVRKKKIAWVQRICVPLFIVSGLRQVGQRVIFVLLDFVNESFLHFCYQYHCSLYLIIVSSKLFFISICNLCFLCLLLEQEQGSCIWFEILVAGWSLNLGVPFLNHDICWSQGLEINLPYINPYFCPFLVNQQFKKKDFTHFFVLIWCSFNNCKCQIFTAVKFLRLKE